MTIQDLVHTKIDTPRGLVKVELFDERGKLKQREEGENFISILMQKHMKWWQQYLWGTYHPNHGVDTYGRKASQPSPLPFNSIGAWNYTAAEAPLTERQYMGGPLVAYASRFNQGSPTLQRGVINNSDSVATPNSHTWVWDWLTTTGNGTFQSVGWMNTGSLLLPAALWPDPFYSTRAPLSLSNTGVGSFRSALYWDGTNYFTMACMVTPPVSGSSPYSLCSVDPTTGVLTQVFTTAINYSTGSAVYPNAICKLGTDWIIVGSTTNSGGSTTIRRYDSGGTLQQTVVHDGGASEIAATVYGLDITTDGTNLYISCTNGRVYRLDGTTLLITATITPALDSTNGICGVAWDGTDLACFNAAGKFWFMDTSGVTILTKPMCLYLGASADSGTATSPFSGTFVVPGSPMAAAHDLIFWINGTNNAMDDLAAGASFGSLSSNGINVNSGSQGGGAIAFRGTDLYQFSGATFVPYTTAGGTAIVELTHSALGSRVLLGAPVTKTSAQTMKITYNLLFS